MRSLKVTAADGICHDLYPGAVLQFGEDTSCRYILHYGEYNILNSSTQTKMLGWYVQQIGSLVAISVTDDMLASVDILNNGALVTLGGSTGDCNQCNQCNPNRASKSARFTEDDAYILSRTFITVDTIAERDALIDNLTKTGRLIEVNNVEDDGPKYYRWDFQKGEFVDVKFVHSDVAAELKTLVDTVQKLSENLAEVSEELETLKRSINTSDEDPSNTDIQIKA